jgi:hypothetical protein
MPHTLRREINCNVAITERISLFNVRYKVLTNTSILHTQLVLHAEENLGDHQCGFRNERSTTDNLEKFYGLNLDLHFSAVLWLNK